MSSFTADLRIGEYARTVVECVERDRLSREYSEALNLLRMCVDELERPAMPNPLSGLLAARAAKDLCKVTREACEKHIRNHGCDMAFLKSAAAR